MSNKKSNQVVSIDVKAIIAGLGLPKHTFVTIHPSEGYLMVGSDVPDLDLTKATKKFQATAAKWSLAEQAAVRDLFVPKSSKTSQPPIEGWCMKCKANVPLETYEVVVNARGGKSAKSTCPVCGTQVYKFLPRDAEITGTLAVLDDIKTLNANKSKDNDAKAAVAKENARLLSTDVQYMTVEDLRAFVLEDVRASDAKMGTAPKARKTNEANVAQMPVKNLRAYTKSALLQREATARVTLEDAAKADKKIAAKPVHERGTKAASGNWANVKVGSTPEGNFYCSKCNWKGQSKVIRIANGSRDVGSLYAYAVCKCGANMNHKVSSAAK